MLQIYLIVVVVGLLTGSFSLALGQSSGVVKILSTSSYIDSIDSLHVVGEIENGSPNVITFVQVVGTFYDNNGKVAGTSFTYTNPYTIGPQGKAPFDLILSEASIPIRQIQNYTVAVNYQ